MNINAMEKNVKILLIPDVHARDFWREPVKEMLTEKKEGTRIIFMGDYCDPYSEDFPTDFDYQAKAIDTFREIIALKKEHPEYITLLIGNHDCGYMFNLRICDCRTDYRRYGDIHKIFNDNKDLFQLVDQETINGKHFIISHAGIPKGYAEYCFEDVNENNVVDIFNNAYKENNQEIIRSLGIYDSYRGYFGGNFGSLVWSDVRSWMDNDKDGSYGYGYNVFAHSQLIKECGGIITDYWADLDCQEAFYINELGEIKTFFEKKEEKNLEN